MDISKDFQIPCFTPFIHAEILYAAAGNSACIIDHDIEVVARGV